MADWTTVASFATAGGTLVLAVATFSAVRSSNRTARIAEETLLTGIRPLLIPSLPDDPDHKVLWHDRHAAHISGGRAISKRKTGSSISPSDYETSVRVLHCSTGGTRCPTRRSNVPHVPAEDFRRLTIDLYIPAGGSGYWEAAVRDRDDTFRPDFIRSRRSDYPSRSTFSTVTDKADSTR